MSLRPPSSRTTPSSPSWRSTSDRTRSPRWRRRSAIKTKLDGYPAETLGGLTIGVSPLEMAGAYSTIANGGVRHDPTAIERVVFPNGEVDRPGRSKPVRVLSEAEAYEVTKILHDNITGGTGTGAYTGCGGQAGKTGTTDNQVDAWFVGYQPNLAAATWVGYPESNDISTGLDGGSVPASIWGSFFSGAGDPVRRDPDPGRADRLGRLRRRLHRLADTKSEFDPDDPDQTDETPTRTAPGRHSGRHRPGRQPDAYAPGVGQDPAGDRAPAPAPAPAPRRRLPPSNPSGGFSPG